MFKPLLSSINEIGIERTYCYLCGGGEGVHEQEITWLESNSLPMRGTNPLGESLRLRNRLLEKTNNGSYYRQLVIA